MKSILFHSCAWIGLFAGALLLTQSAYSEEVEEFTVVIESGEGVTGGDGEAANKNDEITQDNVSDFTFGDGAFLIVRNKATGIKYRVNNAADLAFLGNALATNTNGVAIGRWVVGGGARSIERSTLLSLSRGTGTFLPRPTLETLPAATPAGP